MVLELSDKAFKRLSQMVYDRFRIMLTERKRALIVSRLSRLIQTKGFTSFEGYLDWIQEKGGGEALSELVNRISTNFTFFNREKEHFDFFQDTALKQFEGNPARSGKRFHVWVAGCSTGEEPWMLALRMAEFFGPQVSSRAAILATDISARALTIALEGHYTEENTSRLPESLRRKYFESAGSQTWRIRDSLRSLVLFRRLNLNRETFPFKQPFDAIFCRNVMIYFDQETRMKLAAQFHDLLHPGGYLFIGHSESLGRSNQYDYIKPAVYRKTGA